VTSDGSWWTREVQKQRTASAGRAWAWKVWAVLGCTNVLQSWLAAERGATWLAGLFALLSLGFAAYAVLAYQASRPAGR
jgi:hypothetical protein